MTPYLHCELDIWVERVRVIEEIIEGGLTASPNTESVVNVPTIGKNIIVDIFEKAPVDPSATRKESGLLMGSPSCDWKIVSSNEQMLVPRQVGMRDLNSKTY